MIRRLGWTGLEVQSVGFGGLGLSSTYTRTDDESALAVVGRALELGVGYFDTADIYGLGHNEKIVGKALASDRYRVVLATKFGQIQLPDGGRMVNGRPEYVLSACDASLKRLGVEFIDLYYAHRVDPDVPIEETVGAMADLVASGKVRFLGLSEAAPQTIRRAHSVHPIAAIQVEYSLMTRFAEKELIPLCDELDIGFVAYSPLCRGFLTGLIAGVDDLRPGDRRLIYPRFQADALKQNSRLLPALRAVADSHAASLAQVALAWILAQSDRVVPIPSTVSLSHLEEDVAAAKTVLSSEELSRLASVFVEDAAAGDRYPPDGLEKLQK